MKLSKVLCACTAAASDAAILSLLMITVSIGGSRGQAQPLPLLWIALAAGSAAVNLLLFRRGIPVPALAAVNGGLYALTLVLFFLLFPLVEGPFGYLMTITFPAISAGRAIYHAWHTPALQTQLTRIDITLACIAWSLLLAGAEHAMELLTGSLAVLLVLHGVCAVALRVGDPEGEEDSAPLVGAPVRGVLFSAGVVAALIALVLGLTRALGDSSRTAVSTFFQGVKTLFQAIWMALDAFFGWLFSLFPQTGGDTLPPVSAAPLPSPAADPTGEGMAGLLPFAAALIGAAAVVGLIVLLLRLRKVSLRTGGRTVSRRRGAVTRARRAGLLGRRWRALLEELHFRLLALRYASTPAGLLVRLEAWGKRRKTPRGPGEPVRAYLLRLDPEGELLPLADALDARFYGPGGSTLSPAQCRALRARFLRKARAGGKVRKSAETP